MHGIYQGQSRTARLMTEATEVQVVIKLWVSTRGIGISQDWTWINIRIGRLTSDST